MQILHYTDDYGWPREAVVKATFRDEEGKRFAVIPRRRGPYDTQPPFCTIEIGRNGARLGKAEVLFDSEGGAWYPPRE